MPTWILMRSLPRSSWICSKLASAAQSSPPTRSTACGSVPVSEDVSRPPHPASSASASTERKISTAYRIAGA
eukprot:2803731-Rhodomonas_salina.4